MRSYEIRYRNKTIKFYIMKTEQNKATNILEMTGLKNKEKGEYASELTQGICQWRARGPGSSICLVNEYFNFERLNSYIFT